MDAETVRYLAAGLTTAIAGTLPAIGEAWVCKTAIDAMGRNPSIANEIFPKMVVACAIVESTAIYGLVVSLLLIFAV